MNTFASRPFFGFACSILLSTLAFAAACSSSDSNDDISADEAATRASSALCDKLETCAPLLIRVSYGDVATCKTRSKLGVQPALTASGTSLTPSQLATCADDLGGASCEAVTGRTPPASCLAKAGTLADGTACGTDQQCQNRLCRKQPGATCGACSKLGAAGETCAGNDECDPGLACANGTCVAYGAAGVTCDANHPCNPTLACKSGTCVVPAEAGQACDPIGLQSNCNLAKGLACGVDKLCAPLEFAGAGQPCGLVNGKLVGCSGAGSCRTKAGTSTCQAPAADGSPCDEAAGPSCLAPARCVGKVCKIDDPSSCR